MDEAQPWGPALARTDRPRPAALRVLRALTEVDGASVATLTAQLGGHPNALRQQLEHLVTEGFAAATVTPSTGRGRPCLTYQATLSGQQVAAQETDLGDQSALLDAVSDLLALGPDPAATAAELGRAWGHRLTTTDAPHPEVSDLLARQGFTPLPTEDGLLLQTCPLLQAARRRPGIVCGIHQGMVSAIAERAVTLLPFGAPAGCLVRM